MSCVDCRGTGLEKKQEVTTQKPCPNCAGKNNFSDYLRLINITKI